VSDTPRTDILLVVHDLDPKPDTIINHARQLERELNAANERIQLLIAERDTARRQADQNYKLREEFTELLGTDDVEQGVAVVREMKERIKRLESWIDSLETLEQHSGILPEGEWLGSVIGYLRKGEAVYKGEAKP